MQSFKSYYTEDTDLRELLEHFVDLGLFEGFDDSLLAEARGGSALRAVAKTIAVFQTGKAVRTSNRIQSSNAPQEIKLLSQQLSAVAAIALISAFLATGDRAIASRARSLGKGK